MTPTDEKLIAEVAEHHERLVLAAAVIAGYTSDPHNNRARDIRAADAFIIRLASRLEQALSTGPAHDAGLIEAMARLEAALERADRHRIIAVRVMKPDLRLILQALAGEGGKVNLSAKGREGRLKRLAWNLQDALDNRGTYEAGDTDTADIRSVLADLAYQSAQLARMAEALRPFAKLADKFQGSVVEICQPHPDNPSPHIEPFPITNFRAAAWAIS